jgi:hypothetical protein
MAESLCETCQHWKLREVQVKHHRMMERYCTQGTRVLPFYCWKHEPYPRPLYPTRFERILREDEDA